VQVGDAAVGGGLGPGEVGVFVNGDGSAAEYLDGGNLVVERNLGNIRAPFPAEIITGEVHILEETGAASRAVGLTARTGIPPTGTVVAVGPYFEPGLAPAIDPNTLAVISPGLAADAFTIAKLFHEDHPGPRIIDRTVLNAAMMRLADNCLDSIVLRRCFYRNKETA